MLGDLPDQRLAVGLGHPVARLDLLIRRDDRVEIVLEVGSGRHVTAGGLLKVPLGAVHLLKERGEIVAVHPLSVTATDRLSKKVSQCIEPTTSDF